MSQLENTSQDAVIIPFDTYTVHYYSQSSNPWEAAYINCFEIKGNVKTQAGYIVFTYADKTLLPGQENITVLPTSIPNTQYNRLEPFRNRDFFVIYYDISRFSDVLNLLKNASQGSKSVCASCDPYAHVWALVHNVHVKVGVD